MRLENKYIAIKALHEKKGYPIAGLCELAQLNRSSYYKWLRRDQNAQEGKDKELIDCMSVLYQESNSIFGYRRMQMNLVRRFDLRCNKKRVYRVMRAIKNHNKQQKKKREKQGYKEEREARERRDKKRAKTNP